MVQIRYVSVQGGAFRGDPVAFMEAIKKRLKYGRLSFATINFQSLVRNKQVKLATF